MIDGRRENVIMIKIKHKELAVLLDTTEGYSKTLLNRKKLRLNNKYLFEIIDLIVARRRKKEVIPPP
jgi:hypothetical protein